MIKFLDIQKITQQHKDEIKEAVNRVVDSGWYLLGKEVKEFENKFSEYCQVALILSSTKYTEVDYIRDFDEFISIKNRLVDL